VGADKVEDVINLMENRKALQSFKKQANLTHHLPVTKDVAATHLYEVQTMEQRHQKEAIQ
jgi:hypothetical protein